MDRCVGAWGLVSGRAEGRARKGRSAKHFPTAGLHGQGWGMILWRILLRILRLCWCLSGRLSWRAVWRLSGIGPEGFDRWADVRTRVIAFSDQLRRLQSIGFLTLYCVPVVPSVPDARQSEPRSRAARLSHQRCGRIPKDARPMLVVRALADPWAAKRQRWWGSAGTARQLRLIGPAAMLDAIRKAWVHGLSAKVEVRFARMTHGPAAHLLRQVEQASLVRNLGAWLGRHQTAGRRRWDRRLLITGALPQEAARANRDDLGQIRARIRQRLRRDTARRGAAWRSSRRASAWPRRRLCRSSGSLCGGLWRRSLGGWFGRSLLGRLLLLIGLHRGRAGLQAQPVRLADHCIAANTAQFLGNLAGGRAAFPHLLERTNSLIGPSH